MMRGGLSMSADRRAAMRVRAVNRGPQLGEKLPRPDAKALALIGRACGARPGDRGPSDYAGGVPVP